MATQDSWVHHTMRARLGVKPLVSWTASVIGAIGFRLAKSEGLTCTAEAIVMSVRGAEGDGGSVQPTYVAELRLRAVRGVRGGWLLVCHQPPIERVRSVPSRDAYIPIKGREARVVRS